MPNGWVHETIDLIAYGRPYRRVHKTKDAESQRKPGRRHREVNHEWYQAFSKLWSFSDPFPDSLMETIQRLRDSEGYDRAEERMVSDTHDYIDKVWDWDDLSMPERARRRKYWEGLFAWLLFHPEVLRDWAGVDVLDGEIQRLIGDQEIWQDAPDIKSKYEGLLRRVEFVKSKDRALREMLECYGQEA